MIHLKIHEKPLKNSDRVFIAEKKEVLLKEASALLTKDEMQRLKKSLSNNDSKIETFHKRNFSIFFSKVNTAKKPDYIACEEFRKCGSKLALSANEQKITTLALIPLEISDDNILAFAEGIILSSYQFIQYKSKQNEIKNTLENIHICSSHLDKTKLKWIQIIIRNVYLCRDLVNEPVCTLNSIEFSRRVEGLFKNTKAKIDILGKTKIETLKMNGLLAVNKGSIDPPAFIIIEWKPTKHINKNPYVFIGKGLMYDTGGINVKTASGMEAMKSDMAGGAAVVATMLAVAQAELPVYAVGLVPVTDNRPTGNSLVPGDIIKYSNGTTVEVLNSDAEGRLILADGILYAKKYKPKLVITIATLTGAAQAAIGKYGIVTLQKDADEEFQLLCQSGKNVYERLVEFPFWEEYDDLIKSDVADIKNIGGPIAGAITAGKFLARFAESPFIHLDIAGPAYYDKKDHYRTAGGSGIGVRLFFDFLKNKIISQ